MYITQLTGFSYIAKAGFELLHLLFHLPNAGVIGMYCYAWLGRFSKRLSELKATQGTST